MSDIKHKMQRLNEIAIELKQELYGIDNIIDRVIKSISGWYIAPEIVTRPVIINLWGMTGVGKTDLVRKLVQKLDFQSRFVEIQMDGGSEKKGTFNKSIQSTLSRSTINEGQPGILLLDEMQRYRTISPNENEIKNDAYKDVWTLLSDGRFSIDASIFDDLEMMLHCRAYSDDRKQAGIEDEDDDGISPKKLAKTKFKLYPYEAKELKQLLKLPNSIDEIMTWSSEHVITEIKNVKYNKKEWEADYTKLLIFISGNLDSAFEGAISTNDCDTDADFFHELTKKVSITEIKYHLKKRFSPEQVARFGNNHVIYPSLNKSTYQRLIARNINQHVTDFSKLSGYNYQIDESVNEQIYINSVYPTQGTRPVFSSVHMIFSQLLMDITVYCIENDIDKNQNIKIKMHDFSNVSVDIGDNTLTFPILLELNQKRKRGNANLKTMVAVHEAGHALVYALLKKTSPHETKSNAASYEGGYVLPSINEHSTDISALAELENDIQVFLAGKVAEIVVFGKEHQSDGCGSDIRNATRLASNIIRVYGMKDTIGRIDTEGEHTFWITSLAETDNKVEQILANAMERTKKLIIENKGMLAAITDKLIEGETITHAQMNQMFIENGYTMFEEEVRIQYQTMYQHFKNNV